MSPSPVPTSRWLGGDIAVLRFLGLLLAIDVAFTLAHLLQAELGLPALARLDSEGGYPEHWGYAKLLFVALSLAVLQRRRASPVLAGWSVTLAVVVADDALALHEGGGKRVAERFGYQDVLRLRAADLGELTVWAFLAVTLSLVLFALHRRADERSRLISSNLAALLAVLAMFAIGADMAHQVAPSALRTVAILVEDGGELLAQTALATYVVAMLRSDDGGRVPSLRPGWS